MNENDITLHKAILIIVKGLKNGRNMVIDDENNSSKTRKSIIDGIRKKVDLIEIKCIQFIPFGGILQVLWANQFAISQKTLIKNGKIEKEGYSDQLDQKILFTKYFDTSLSNPLQSEGFDHPIEQITTNLYANNSTNSSRMWFSQNLAFDQKALLIDSSQLFFFSPKKALDSQSELHSYQLNWRNKNIPKQLALFSKNFPNIR